MNKRCSLFLLKHYQKNKHKGTQKNQIKNESLSKLKYKPKAQMKATTTEETTNT